MPEKKPAAGTLAAYMQDRRRNVEQSQSERFALPFYPAIEVELRPVDYKREYQIGKAVNKQTKSEADRILYIAADVLSEATVGFFVNGQPVAGEDNSWNGLARAAYPEATELNRRQAIIRLLSPDGVGKLFTEYQDWRASRGEDTAEEVEEDLEATR